jgi:hypothetical protein
MPKDDAQHCLFLTGQRIPTPVKAENAIVGDQ